MGQHASSTPLAVAHDGCLKLPGASSRALGSNCCGLRSDRYSRLGPTLTLLGRTKRAFPQISCTGTRASSSTLFRDDCVPPSFVGRCTLIWPWHSSHIIPEKNTTTGLLSWQLRKLFGPRKGSRKDRKVGFTMTLFDSLFASKPTKYIDFFLRLLLVHFC
jgi:hypothetical protein